MQTKLKAVVIGVGAMGRNHARVYAEIQDVTLVAVSDTDQERADSIATQYNVSAYSDYKKMISEEKPDVVTIAVPTPLHLEVATYVMEQGCHVLLEKPIAQSIEDGQKLIEAAEKSGVIMTVGHIERFNPAVQQLKERLQKNELGVLHYIEARRQGPYPSRMSDIGVIIDLAVHDLDILSFVTGKKIDRLYAETKQCVSEDSDDILSGVAHLEGGIVGSLNINWVTPTKIRELYVTGEAGTFHVNYITQDLTFFENEKGDPSTSWEAMGNLRGVSEGNMIRYKVRKEEPLKAEVNAFLGAVREGGEPPVKGSCALEARRLAGMLVESGQNCSVIKIT